MWGCPYSGLAETCGVVNGPTGILKYECCQSGRIFGRIKFRSPTAIGERNVRATISSGVTSGSLKSGYTKFLGAASSEERIDETC